MDRPALDGPTVSARRLATLAAVCVTLLTAGAPRAQEPAETHRLRISAKPGDLLKDEFEHRGRTVIPERSVDIRDTKTRVTTTRVYGLSPAGVLDLEVRVTRIAETILDGRRRLVFDSADPDHVRVVGQNRAQYPRFAGWLDLLALVVRYKLDPRGTVVESRFDLPTTRHDAQVVEADDLQLAAALRLPAEPVAIGESWAGKEDRLAVMGLGRLVTRERVVLVGTRVQAGERVADLRVDMTAAFEPDTESGFVATMTEFRGTGTVVFAVARGRLLHATLNLAAALLVKGEGGESHLRVTSDNARKAVE